MLEETSRHIESIRAAIDTVYRVARQPEDLSREDWREFVARDEGELSFEHFDFLLQQDPQVAMPFFAPALAYAAAKRPGYGDLAERAVIYVKRERVAFANLALVGPVLEALSAVLWSWISEYKVCQFGQSDELWRRWMVAVEGGGERDRLLSTLVEELEDEVCDQVVERILERMSALPNERPVSGHLLDLCLCCVWGTPVTYRIYTHRSLGAVLMDPRALGSHWANAEPLVSKMAPRAYVDLLMDVLRSIGVRVRRDR